MVQVERIIEPTAAVMKVVRAIPTQLHFVDATTTMQGPSPCIIIRCSLVCLFI